jgi:hypothetical protein
MANPRARRQGRAHPMRRAPEAGDGDLLERTASFPLFLPKFAEHRKTGAPPGALTGAGSRNRTHDQRFTKPLLYQLSYAGMREL